MATFDELMETFRNPGENGVSETFADDIATAFKDEVSTREAAIAARDKMIADKEKAIADRDVELLRVKAVNYDKFMAAPKPGEPATTDETADTDVSGGIDSLFE